MDQVSRAPGFFRRFWAHLENVLEWPSTDKCLLIAAATFPYSVSILRFNLRALQDPSLAPFFDRGFLEKHLPLAWGTFLWWAAMIAAGFSIRRRSPENPLYKHLVIQAWWVSPALLAYFLGTLTTPFVLALLVNGVVGFLFFDAVSAGFGVASALLVLLATGFLEQAGKIPYAPLLGKNPFEGGHLSPWWFTNLGSSYFVLFVTFLVVFAYVIARWRDRERALSRAYAELQDAKEGLVRAESLAALGSLVSGAAHELRNPLASSGAILQSLSDEIAGAPGLAEEARSEMKESLALALKGQRRATAIVGRLLDLTDALASTAERRSLAALVESLAGRYPGVRVVREGTRDARVSERAVAVILSNLLDNAMAAGGKEPPSLRVRRDPADSSFVELSVSDTGRGIPAEIRGEAFKPFFTGQKTGEGHGVGLGLYIVHELSARLGGSVSLESAINQGTRVTVKFPAGEA